MGTLLRRLPGGYLCQLFPDGGWVASSGKALTHWSSTGEKLWELPGSWSIKDHMKELGRYHRQGKGTRLLYRVPTDEPAFPKNFRLVYSSLVDRASRHGPAVLAEA
jgi:hypothetical protein